MKKLFFAAVLTVAIALGGYHYYNANDTESLSDIAKANIEALADRVLIGDHCFSANTGECIIYFNGEELFRGYPYLPYEQ